MIKNTKNIDLTSSTKKSGVIDIENIDNMIEQLIDNLQKFDEMKVNSKRIKLLIQ